MTIPSYDPRKIDSLREDLDNQTFQRRLGGRTFKAGVLALAYVGVRAIMGADINASAIDTIPAIAGLGLTMVGGVTYCLFGADEMDTRREIQRRERHTEAN
jgi:hypothetical protein